MLWALGLLVLLPSVLSLRSARRWLSFIHRYRQGAGSPLPTRGTGPPDAVQSGASHSPLSTQDDTPPLSLIVPCRGYETGLEENLAAYGQQDYPDYELIFATSGTGGSGVGDGQHHPWRPAHLRRTPVGRGGKR